MEAIRRSFLSQSNPSKHVCIVRMKGRPPYLLHPQAFDELFTRLSDRIECGALDALPDSEIPAALQSIIAPGDDLRYITAVTFHGGSSSPSCHIYQRKFSSQYLPLGLGLAVSNDQQTSVMGAVDPILKAQLEDNTLQLVKHLASKHRLAVSKIVCEHIRDSQGRIYLLSVVHIDYASMTNERERAEEATSEVTAAADINKDDQKVAKLLSNSLLNETSPPSPHQVGVNVVPPWMISSAHSSPDLKPSRIFSASPKTRGGAALSSTRPIISASPFSSAKKALGPVSYLTANGIHTNNGSRPSSALTGAPAMIKRLADEVDVLKKKLQLKDKEIEALEERLVQSELGRKKDIMEHEIYCSDLRRRNDDLCQELKALRAMSQELKCRAEIAEGKFEIIEKERQDIRTEFQEEINAALTSLRSAQIASERNEAEVLRLNELLRVERSQPNAFTNQSLSYDNTQSSSAFNDPTLSEVVTKVKTLLDCQENPDGESYAVKKMLHAHRGDLQELFLYFSQLGSSSARPWPPVLSYPQWLLFCSQHSLVESKSSGLSGLSPHPRFISSGMKKISSKEIETIFLMHSDTDPASPQALQETTSTPKSPQQRQHSGHLTYSSFLASLMQMSVKLCPNPFLTDSLNQVISLLANKKTFARPSSPAKERTSSPTKKRVETTRKKPAKPKSSLQQP